MKRSLGGSNLYGWHAQCQCKSAGSSRVGWARKPRVSLFLTVEPLHYSPSPRFVGCRPYWLGAVRQLFQSLWRGPSAISVLMTLSVSYFSAYGAVRQLFQSLWRSPSAISALMVRSVSYFSPYGAVRQLFQSLWRGPSAVSVLMARSIICFMSLLAQPPSV